MDFLSLYAAGKLFSLSLSPGRMVPAAALGAVYAVAAVSLGWSGFWGALAAAIVSAGMSALAFGIRGGWRAFLRTFAAVWGCGALLGGIMTVFCGFVDSGVRGAPYADLYIASALAILGLIRMAAGRIRRGYAHVRFCRQENTYSGKALIDSGNLLRDPLSGTPVILLAGKEAAPPATDAAETMFLGYPAPWSESGGGVRAVPVRGVGGSRLLYGFFCRSVTVEFRGKQGTYSAVICVDPEAESYGGCGVLLPASLVP